MIVSLLKIAACMAGLIGLLVAVKSAGKRYALGAEWQRKLLHVGLGLFSMSFPFIFQRAWEVLILCAASAGVMLSIRFLPGLRRSVGGSLYDVNRSSLGELLFAVSIALLFWLSKDEPVTYVIPMLILTLSDAAAAIVGVHYGRHTYRIAQGMKSWQGTAAFTVVTFGLSVSLLAWLTDLPVLHVVIIAAVLAWLGALIEAVSWYGVDNVVVPVGLYLLLDRLLTTQPAMLASILLVLLGLTGLGVVTARRARLNVHALLSGIILAFCFWIIGGLPWLYPLLVVFFTHVVMAKRHPESETFDIRAILSLMLTALPWLLLYRVYQNDSGYYLLLLSLAVHWQINFLLSLRALRGRPAEMSLLFGASLIATLALLSMQPLIDGVTARNMLLLVAGFTILFLGGLLFRVSADRLSRERWIEQSLFSLSGSVIGIFPLLLSMRLT
ncbi:MAG TPA: hypothetical protein VF268_03025 [Gammaproteobacteria bacterium]